MKKTTIDCDRCGEQNIASVAGWISVVVTFQTYGPTKVDYDLCASCARTVDAVLKQKVHR